MISIIMSTYNEHICEIKASINSILCQTITNFELIIIDDNPNYLELKQYLLNVQKLDKRIRVYFNKTNIGAAEARNVGIKYSSGDFIAITDADDISKSTRLEKQLKFLKYNNLDFVFSNYKIIKNNKLSNCVYNFNSIVNENIIKYLFAYYENISLQSSWLIKRKVFFKLKGYRNIIIEDYDFNVRAITYGYRLGYQNDVLIIKRERENSISNQNLLSQYVTLKSIQRFIKKDNYNNIISLDNIKRCVDPFTTKEEIHKFKLFLKAGHDIKYNTNIVKSIIIFFYLLYSSRNALNFLLNLFVIKIKSFKVNKL